MGDFSKIDLALTKFEPIVPVMTGHTQTLLGHLVPSLTEQAEYQPHVLRLLDGDSLFLEYIDRKSKTTVSIYHGLGGDAGADYVRRTAQIAASFGWNVILVNHRKASPKAPATRTYHSGRGEDASAVIHWAREFFTGARQVAVGFSMSGSILLNLVSKRYGEHQPDYAVVVNAPLDLGKASRMLSSGFSKIYDLRFYLILKSIIQEEQKLKMPLIGRTYDIDEFYTSKINGFRDAEDYYGRCSALNHVSEIKTKTFVLSSYDDPFIDVQDYLNAKWSPSVNLYLSQFGGHMGYFSKKGDPKHGRRWLDHYLESVFLKIQELG